MVLRRPASHLGFAARLSARFHPRRLRHRLPLALAVAVAALSLPRALLGSDDPGPGRPVLVATRDLAPGTVVTTDDVRSVVAPAALEPPGAVRTLAPGSVVRSPIERGEVLVEHRVGGGAGVPDRLEADQRAVTVPWPEARPPLAVGDTADLVVTAAVGSAGVASSRVVVSRAEVLVVGEDGVTLAVPAEQAPQVHQGLATGVVDLAVTPFRP
jgi:Flp pilus assembly protein CpaB